MDLTTRPSLLARLKREPKDQDWNDFYEQYARVILSFARKQGLDEHSAQDVLQETMVLLIQKLPKFDYDPQKGRFRGWLFATVRNKTKEAFRRRAQEASTPLSTEELQASKGVDLSVAPLNDSPDTGAQSEWRRCLWEEGCRRVLSERVLEPSTARVFQLLVLERRPVAEAVVATGLKRNAVYQAKRRGLLQLKAKLNALQREQPLEEP